MNIFKWASLVTVFRANEKKNAGRRRASYQDVDSFHLSIPLSIHSTDTLRGPIPPRSLPLSVDGLFHGTARGMDQMDRHTGYSKFAAEYAVRHS
jgi:hypothetical protein